jgi:hypothetical protein
LVAQNLLRLNQPDIFRGKTVTGFLQLARNLAQIGTPPFPEHGRYDRQARVLRVETVPLSSR